MKPVGAAAQQQAVALRRAYEAIDKWQKVISDHKYTDIAEKPEAEQQTRFEQQQELVRAATHSSADYLRVVMAQVGGHLTEAVLDAMPVLAPPVKPDALASPDWVTDKAIHASLTAGGATRALVSNYCWWHLLTLRQVRDGTLDNPPTFLLNTGITGNLGFNRELLEQPFSTTTAEERKPLDTPAIRNLLRRSGGIFHRKSRYLIDSLLATAWWKAELAETAAADPATSLTAEAIYNTLQASSAWRKLLNSSSVSASRLAHPRLIAAVCIALKQHDPAPTSTEADQIITTLLRRTLQVCVPLVDPEVLAELAT